VEQKMGFEIGERIMFQDEAEYGQYETGKIVGIAKNSLDMIITYLVELDSRQYVQINPYNVCRC
jgi:hypothetical protein